MICFPAQPKHSPIILTQEGRQQHLANKFTLSALGWKCLYTPLLKNTPGVAIVRRGAGGAGAAVVGMLR